MPGSVLISLAPGGDASGCRTLSSLRTPDKYVSAFQTISGENTAPLSFEGSSPPTCYALRYAA